MVAGSSQLAHSSAFSLLRDFQHTRPAQSRLKYWPRSPCYDQRMLSRVYQLYRLSSSRPNHYPRKEGRGFNCHSEEWQLFRSLLLSGKRVVGQPVTLREWQLFQEICQRYFRYRIDMGELSNLNAQASVSRLSTWVCLTLNLNSSKEVRNCILTLKHRQ